MNLLNVSIRITLLFILGCFGSLSLLGQKASFTKAIETSVPVLLKKYHVPAAAVAVIEKGKLVYKKGFGVSDVVRNKPLDASTIFHVASISKTVTAIGILRLATKGKINLDSPFTKYVHSWKPPASNFNENKITIRQLLSHTAGISSRSASYYLSKKEMPTIVDELTKGKTGRGVILSNEPGTKWSYSAGGYLMLQLLIEEVTDKPFEMFMQEEIFKPLKMFHTSFELDSTKATKLYDFNLKQTPYEYFPAEAAASLNTTVEDFSTLLIHAFLPGNKFLGAQKLREAFEPAAGSDSTYGLGVFYEKPVNNQRIIGHDGGNPGVRSIFKFNPVTGDGIVIFTNSSYGTSVYNDILCQWYRLKAKTENTNYCNSLADISNQILANIYTGTPEEAVSFYAKEKEKNQQLNFPEPYLSYWAYGLNERGFGEDAIKLLLFDVRVNPKTPNAFDSLADIYLKNGYKKEALQAFKNLLALDPNNKTAQEGIKKLSSE